MSSEEIFGKENSVRHWGNTKLSQFGLWAFHKVSKLWTPECGGSVIRCEFRWHEKRHVCIQNR